MHVDLEKRCNKSLERCKITLTSFERYIKIKDSQSPAIVDSGDDACLCRLAPRAAGSTLAAAVRLFCLRPIDHRRADPAGSVINHPAIKPNHSEAGSKPPFSRKGGGRGACQIRAQGNLSGVFRAGKVIPGRCPDPPRKRGPSALQLVSAKDHLAA